MRTNDGKVGLRQTSPDAWALFWLLLLEFTILLIALALYKKGEQGAATFAASPAGRVSLGALIIAAVSVVGIRTRYRVSRIKMSSRFGMAVIMNTLILVTGALVGEGTLRLLAGPGVDGPEVRGMALLPLDWKAVAAHRRSAWSQAQATGSYLVHDSLLGWTIAATRTSVDSMYFSSAEGLRSIRSGEQLGSTSAKQRIALVGDSFTFGLEVSYEDTWGAVLQNELGPDVQVLNFGVNGYGVDQAYLRYARDVRSWKPDIVIFGIIDHDLVRTLSVYSFLLFPESGLPFAKPRFRTVDDQLQLLNVPVPTPESIFAAARIDSLPYLDYDVSYNPAAWGSAYLRHSYLARFIISRFPRWRVPDERWSDEAAMSINRAVIRSFIEDVTGDGAVPMLVYLPTRSYFDPTMAEWSGESGSRALRLLKSTGLAYQDMSACVGQLAADERFLTRHYSPEANVAVARCLHQPILEALTH